MSSNELNKRLNPCPHFESRMSRCENFSELDSPGLHVLVQDFTAMTNVRQRISNSSIGEVTRRSGLSSKSRVGCTSR